MWFIEIPGSQSQCTDSNFEDDEDEQASSKELFGGRSNYICGLGGFQPINPRR
jgi:hypothetical protein